MATKTRRNKAAKGGSSPSSCSGFFDFWKPDPVGVILETGYHKFRHRSGIEGLAKVTGGMLEILAVFATAQGTGQFRRFIAAAKESFATVIVWEDWNPAVGAALKRYGFERHGRIEPDGEQLVGWRFDSPNCNYPSTSQHNES